MPYETCLCVYILSRPFPSLSPGKSIGGYSAAFLGCLFHRVLIGWPYGALIVIVFIGAVGDLAASSVKRMEGSKDFGQLLGAHGGVMDRFDGALFATTINVLKCWIIG
eukprot:m.57169 g.57169  ORF g.57169 m.57169 type:complete len:108 (-) comp11086_c0_seq1:9-332(-)